MYYNHHRTHQGKNVLVAEHRWQPYLMEKRIWGGKEFKLKLI
ncbi:Uncharacterised protein [Mannheimia haemolytica]|uniref:Uncharacterized protein n=1 Tax=Mannheimia haemolytica TaxID=75985 RepID=A0A378N5X4_MANHA|nr:Uncharacterised protein [Mannheimia haemolytica]